MACTTAAQATLGGHPKHARRRRKGGTGQGMTAGSAGKLAQGEQPKKLEAQQRQLSHIGPPGPEKQSGRMPASMKKMELPKPLEQQAWQKREDGTAGAAGTAGMAEDEAEGVRKCPQSQDKQRAVGCRATTAYSSPQWCSLPPPPPIEGV